MRAGNPNEKEGNVITRLLTAAAFATLALVPVTASASSPGTDGPAREAAIKACVDFNDHGPASLVDVVGDGLGDYLVWVADNGGHLWACNASGYGDVYANVRVDGDLLGGKGIDLVHKVSDSGWVSPAFKAERVCMAMVKDGKFKPLATVGDGLAGYLVWLESDSGDLTMCNASGKGEVFAFFGVDTPINQPPAGAVS